MIIYLVDKEVEFIPYSSEDLVIMEYNLDNALAMLKEGTVILVTRNHNKDFGDLMSHCDKYVLKETTKIFSKEIAIIKSYYCEERLKMNYELALKVEKLTGKVSTYCKNGMVHSYYSYNLN